MAEKTIDTIKPDRPKRKVWIAVLAAVSALLLFLSLFLTDIAQVKLRKDAKTDTEKTAVEALAESSEFINASASERVSMWLQTVLRSPETYEDYYQIAAILIAQGAYERALPNIARSIELYTGDDQAVLDELYMKQGGLYAMLGRYEEMEESFTHVSDGSAYEAQKLLLIAQAAIEKDDGEKAVKYLSAYIDLTPGDVQMCTVLGQLDIAMEDYAGAAKAYTLALDGSDDSEGGTLHFLRGSCYMSTESYELAREDFIYALEHGYEDLSLCAAQASLSCFLTGEYALCIRYGEQALAEPSEQVLQPELNYYMGVSAMTLNEYERAVAFFDATIEGDETRTDARYYRAVCCMALGGNDEAIAAYTELIEQQYEMQVCLYNRAICYLRKYNLYSARHDLEACIEIGEDEEITAAAKALLKKLY